MDQDHPSGAGADTVLDPQSTAVVLIDLQNRFLDADLAPYSFREVVERAAALAEGARAAGAAVIFVRVEWSDADAPPRNVDSPRPGRPADAPGDWSDFVPGLVRPGDVIVTKRQWGAFYGTDLELVLRRRGVRTIVLAGLATNYGVESTARQGWEMGFDQVVVSDAMATISAEAHAFALDHVFPAIARVRRAAAISFSGRTQVTTAAHRLRKLLAFPSIVVAPGAYDGLTARLVANAGFPAVYMTGAGASAAKGLPDYGLLTLTEMADGAGTMARAVDVPVISDADTGYGNELNVTRTVNEFEARGVAGIHIEDQVAPKRCGHLAGKDVVSRDEFVLKIRAAAAARRDPDFVLIARTDARGVLGYEEAVARANAALAAGADMAFVEAVETLEELADVPRAVRGPCLLNLVPGGRTPMVGEARAQALGYRLLIHPGLALLAATAAVDAALSGLRTTGEPAYSDGVDPAAFYRRLGSQRWDDIRGGALSEGGR